MTTAVSKKILTVTLNPALDKTLTVDSVNSEGETHVRQEWNCAGGKGINVARALQALSWRSTALIVTGGRTGAIVRKSLTNEQITYKNISIAATTRTQLSINDAQGRLIQRLVELGARIQRDERDQFDQRLQTILNNTSFLVLSGSLPPGFPIGTYARWIRYARSLNIPVFLDTRGPALRAGLKAKPDWIKPNREEAQDVLQTRIQSRRQIKFALQTFARMGIAHPFVSLGEDGLAGKIGDTYWQAITEKRPAFQYSVGCGDACVAGLIGGVLGGKNEIDGLCWAVACGFDNLVSPIPGQISKKAVEKMAKHVKVFKI